MPMGTFFAMKKMYQIGADRNTKGRTRERLAQILRQVSLRLAMVVIMIAMMATFTGLFQFVTPLLCLAAVIAVLADGVLQLGFGIVDTLFTFAIVIARKGLHWDGPGKEQGNHKRGYRYLALLKHATFSRKNWRHLIPQSSAAARAG